MNNLIIDPSFTFSDLETALGRAGWSLASSASRPLVPGEPEHAAFERGDEILQYTFNPVCRFRVAELASEPDADTARSLRVVAPAEVLEWLASSDERTALRGLLAARLKPDERYASPVWTLTGHRHKALADAALRASDAIRHTTPADPPRSAAGADAPNDPRAIALAFIETIKRQIEPLLRALPNDRDGSVLASLRPRPDDYARVFSADVVEAARSAYESMWSDVPPLDVPVLNTHLDVHVAPAGMLAFDNELSTHFPSGYRHIAPLLNPHRAWVRWTYSRPGQSSGKSFDGIVWCDDHWAWFPKPFRVLAAHARTPSTS
jgi:hypothetical protein